MKSKNVLIAIILLVLLACIVLGYKTFSPAPTQTAQRTELTPSQARQAMDTPESVSRPQLYPPMRQDSYVFKLVAMSESGKSTDAVREAYNAPINFWGKVVDEKGTPIPDATIEYSIGSKPWQGGDKQNNKSDAYGLFSLIGAKGAGLLVKVSKEGYYITEQSSKILNYAFEGLEGNKLPTAENPVVFVLKKKGEGVKLVQINTKIELPKSGNAVGINLATGGRETPHISIQQQSQSDKRDVNGKFDWTAKVSVLNGGLVERKDPYNFTAPPSGYKQAIEISMTKETPKWINSMDQEYFVKTGDGKYARLTLRLVPAGGYARIVSFLNPTGSNNLEAASVR